MPSLFIFITFQFFSNHKFKFYLCIDWYHAVSQTQNCNPELKKKKKVKQEYKYKKN